MQSNVLKLISICSSGFLLMSCGATTVGTGVTPANFQTLTQSYASNKTFTGESNALVSTPSGVYLASDKQPFSVTKNASGGYDTVSNGENFTFTSAEWDAASNQFIKNVSPTRQVVLSLVSISDSSYKYADLGFAGQNDTAAPLVSAGFGAYGVKTDNMPATNNVTLNGTAVAYISRRDLDANDIVTGDITITAYFTTNKLTGAITSMKSTVNSSDIPGQLNIEDGTITHNSYQASISGSSSLNSAYGEVISGKLQGGFYGPNAEETAGKFTLSSSTYVGVGGFRAK